MNRKRSEGGTLIKVLFLLFLLVGAGGYNYHRNWKLEGSTESRPRPFAAYDQQQLTQLRDAYAAETRNSEQRYSAQERRRIRASGEGLMNERVDEFEQIQRHSTTLRKRASEFALSQTRLQEIEAELTLRANERTGFDLHIRRMIRI